MLEGLSRQSVLQKGIVEVSSFSDNVVNDSELRMPGWLKREALVQSASADPHYQVGTVPYLGISWFLSTGSQDTGPILHYSAISSQVLRSMISGFWVLHSRRSVLLIGRCDLNAPFRSCDIVVGSVTWTRVHDTLTRDSAGISSFNLTSFRLDSDPRQAGSVDSALSSWLACLPWMYGTGLGIHQNRPCRRLRVQLAYQWAQEMLWDDRKICFRLGGGEFEWWECRFLRPSATAIRPTETINSRLWKGKKEKKKKRKTVINLESMISKPDAAYTCILVIDWSFASMPNLSSYEDLYRECFAI